VDAGSGIKEVTVRIETIVAGLIEK